MSVNLSKRVDLRKRVDLTKRTTPTPVIICTVDMGQRPAKARKAANDDGMLARGIARALPMSAAIWVVMALPVGYMVFGR